MVVSDQSPSIPITVPLIGPEEEAAVLEVLRSGWLVQGPKVAELERLVGARVGAEHAVAMSSCTAALHVALASLRLEPGDLVAVPSFTYVAAANSVLHAGGRPLLCDIEPGTYNMDPADLDRRVSAQPPGRVRAVMAVHQFGLAADLDAIGAVADRHGIAVIEDAACALGSTWKGKPVGALAKAGCLSFHPRKVITTGEGGMLLTNDAAAAEEARAWRSHGAMVSDLDRHRSAGGALLPSFSLPGHNYRMTDLQGALGVVQMGRLDGILGARRSLAARYDALLDGLSGLTTPQQAPDGGHSYQSYVCRVVDGRRDSLMARLEAEGIATRQGTHAVHTLTHHATLSGLAPEALPAALAADRETLSLPLFPGMTEAQQSRVAEALRAGLARQELA